MPKRRLALDTNIWIYFLDRKSPFHEKTKQVFAKAEKNWEIVVAQQNILELIEVLLISYRLPVKKAVNEAQLLFNQQVGIIQPLPQTIKTYFTLARTCLKKNNNFDLFLAATLLDNSIANLITNDRTGFKGIKDLQVWLLQEFI